MYEGDILEFKGQWEFLSNFYRSPFRYKSIFWPTSEHAYQVMKVYQGTRLGYRKDLQDVWKNVFPNRPLPAVGWVSEEAFMREFSYISTPGQAKRMGRLLPIREDWDRPEIKQDVMLDVLRHKFAPFTKLAGPLVETGGRHLEEGNRHGDDYWGVDLRKGTGSNHLGKLLMQVREELQSSQ